VVKLKHNGVAFATIYARVYQQVLIHQARISPDSLAISRSVSRFQFLRSTLVSAPVGFSPASLTPILQAVLRGTVTLELFFLFLLFTTGASLHLILRAYVLHVVGSEGFEPP
jgi:hypothetical protein